MNPKVITSTIRVSLSIFLLAQIWTHSHWSVSIILSLMMTDIESRNLVKEHSLR